MRSFSVLRTVLSGFLALGTQYGYADAAADHWAGGQDYNWRDHMTTIDVSDYGWSGNDFGSSFYRDVMRHAERKIEGYSAMTNAHETNHMLNNEVRNATPANDNTLYIGGGKAAMVLEPSLNAAKIKEYLPEFVRSRSSRYQTYLVDQITYWPNVLYQFDEWSAYRTDGRVAREVDQSGNFASAAQGEVCVEDGSIEFLYFASAAVEALHVNEPEYLQNEQFKAAYAFLAEESVANFNYGRGRREFDCDGSMYLEHFRTSPENQTIRETVKNWLGAGWTQRVLGF